MLPQSGTVHYAACVAGALLVLAIGKAIASQRGKAAPVQQS